MWGRRTFHECADELNATSRLFRSAYASEHSEDSANRDSILKDASRRGFELLQILALSIRSDQDYLLTKRDKTPVGALKAKATREEVQKTISSYNPPYSKLIGFEVMELRLALNKIAHVDPRETGFYVDVNTHDLILSGTYKDDIWIAVVSIIDLCTVIKSLPDAQVRS